MNIESVPTPSAQAVGPYSPAVRAGDWIVVSGQIGIEPTTGKVVAGGVEAEARQALANLTAILGDCGCGWEHVAKVTLFVNAESSRWMQEVNAVYADVLAEHRVASVDDVSGPLPARSTVGVAWLPMGAAFEIEAWVYRPLNRPEA
jgi:2-iminobutanoate/2-iminopropanoate deaminase